MYTLCSNQHKRRREASLRQRRRGYTLTYANLIFQQQVPLPLPCFNFIQITPLFLSIPPITNLCQTTNPRWGAETCTLLK